MKIVVHGNKVKVTSSINAYIENKIGKLDKYLENPSDYEATVSISVRGADQTVEVTIPLKKYILRAEDTHNDLYAAIDIVSEKLERQIRKNKTRLKKKIGNKEDFITDFKVSRDEEEKGKIVKRKLVETKPMDCEEAILQMNLLGHDFYVFNNEKTSSVCVVYKRKDSNYGLIETK